jgi:putative transposase
VINPDGTVRKTRRTINLPGHAHELTFSCHDRLPLLSKDRTRLWFIDALKAARERHGFSLWAYVIMPEHVHVLLLPKDESGIEPILASIKLPVSRRAMAYLRSHDPQWLERLKVTRPGGRVEYRFWEQGGGYDRNVIEPDTAWKAVDYIHHNPVRRGLARSITDWPWSSARWYKGEPDVLLPMDGAPPDPSPRL